MDAILPTTSKFDTMKKILFLSFVIVLFSCNNQEKSNTANTTNENQTTQSEITVTEPSETSEGRIQGVYGGCGYNNTPDETTIILYHPRPREINQINSILKFSGLTSNFKIYAANIENAVATIIDNKRYILYDPRLLSFTDEQSGSYWSSMSILAHEIGHHLSGHTLTNKGSNPHDELEADKYSGFVLYKLGASISQATKAIQTLGSDVGSESHPAKRERIEAISKGWREANQTRFDGAIPPPPADNIPLDGTVNTEFTNEMLWSKQSLNEFLEFNPMNEAGGYDFKEGIIIDVKHENEGRISGIVIFDAKSNEKPFINIEDPLDGDKMSRVSLGWFNQIVKPGRRIKYSVYYGGASGNFLYLSYLKMLGN